MSESKEAQQPEDSGSPMSLRERILGAITLRRARLATVVFVANVGLLIITVLAVSMTLLINSANGRRNQAEYSAEQTANQIAEVYASVGEISIPNVARTVDAVLNEPMTAQAFAAAQFVGAAAAAGYDTSRVIDLLTSITEETVLDEFWITDTTGFSYLTNVRDPNGNLVPFGFHPDPAVQPQAYKFYELLYTDIDDFGVVTQPAQVREIDRQVFKYVATNGVDQPRVVQVGNQITFDNEELLTQDLSAGRADVSSTIEGNLENNIFAVGTILDHFVTAAISAGHSREEIESQLDRFTASTSVGEVLVADKSGAVTYVSSPFEEREQMYFAEDLESILADPLATHAETLTHANEDSTQVKYITVARAASDHVIQVGLPLYGSTGSGNIVYIVFQEQAEVLVGRGYPQAIWYLTNDGEVVAAAEYSETESEVATAWTDPFDERAPEVKGLYRDAQETGTTQSITRLGLFNVEQRGSWVVTPVLIAGGNNIGSLVQFVNMDTMAAGILSELRLTILITVLLLVFTGIATYFGTRLLTRPIETIADAARYVETGEQPDYDLIAPVATRSDEIGALARVFQDMTIQVFNREEILETLVSERTSELQSTNKQLRQAQTAINQDLEMAKVVQAALVREGTVDLESFSACARMNPAQMVGGDFVDFQLLEDDIMFIVVGDVSGKGVASALFMAASQAAVKFAAAEHTEVGKITATANDRLCRQNPMGLFVTAIIAKVDLKTGLVDFVSAGHEPPYLLQPNGQRTTLPGTQGIAVGVLDEIDYNSRKITLEPGETLFIYTDGLTDMINVQGELYGKHRLEETLDEVGTYEPHEIVEEIWDSIITFSAGVAAADDMTCLALHRKPKTV